MPIKHKLKDKSGFALTWVILIMVVFLILGISVLSVSVSAAKLAARSEGQLQADYVARSGVESGFKKLISIEPKDDIEDLVSAANALPYLANNTLGSGVYDISFHVDADRSEIIIIQSDAVVGSLTSTVTLRVPTTICMASFNPWLEPPDAWWRAANLWDSIDPDADDTLDLTDYGIAFSGSPTKSPQNGKVPSVFRASVLLFRGVNKSGVTFQQQNNTNDITFDAEVIVFQGDLQLRDSHSQSEVSLDISDDVLEGEMEFGSWTYDEGAGGPAGFEDFDRYLDFIGVAKIVDDPDYLDALAIYGAYNFTASASGEHFGLVSFEGDVYIDEYGSEVALPADFYYYRGKANLYQPGGIDFVDAYDADIDFIRVADDDPIREAIASKLMNFKIVSGTAKDSYGTE